MKVYQLTHRVKIEHIISGVVCFVIINACTFSTKFPLTVDDIDTLTPYREHLASLKTKENPDTAVQPPVETIVEDTAAIAETAIINNTSHFKWTICAGTFRKKRNAIHFFQQLSKEQNTFVVVRDSSYIVAIGLFENREIACTYRNQKALTQTTIIQLKPHEALLREFPD